MKKVKDQGLLCLKINPPKWTMNCRNVSFGAKWKLLLLALEYKAFFVMAVESFGLGIT